MSFEFQNQICFIFVLSVQHVILLKQLYVNFCPSPRLLPKQLYVNCCFQHKRDRKLAENYCLDAKTLTKKRFFEHI